jgi:hypothetical protein
MIELRILRSYVWKPDHIPIRDRIYGPGGRDQQTYTLEAVDTLQALGPDGVWSDVPVEEQQRPPHPREVAEKAETEERSELITAALKKLAEPRCRCVGTTVPGTNRCAVCGGRVGP